MAGPSFISAVTPFQDLITDRRGEPLCSNPEPGMAVSDISGNQRSVRLLAVARCLTQRPHRLTLAEECGAFLTRPRVGIAVIWPTRKRSRRGANLELCDCFQKRIAIKDFAADCRFAGSQMSRHVHDATGVLGARPSARHNSPKFSRLDSSAARSDAWALVYRKSMSGRVHPATAIRPPSEPPAASQRWAAVCLSRWG
jgi:hypothetical protein